MIEWFAINWAWFLAGMIIVIPLGCLMFLVVAVLMKIDEEHAPLTRSWTLTAIISFVVGIAALLCGGVCKLFFIISIVCNLMIWFKGH